MGNRVLRVLFSVCFAVCICSQIFAQETTKPERKNSLEKGKWALQFGVTGNFQITGYYSGTVSVKKHTSDAKAWRVSLSTRLNYSDRSNSEQAIVNGNNQWHDIDESPFDVDATLNLERQWYKQHLNRFVYYFGLGPVLNYGYSYNKRSYYDPTRNQIFRRIQAGAGLTLLAGAECFVTKQISITGEYSAVTRFVYDEQIQTTSYPGVYSRTIAVSRNISFSSSTVRMGLAIYF